MPFPTSHSIPQREIPSGLSTVPSTLTDVTTSDSWLFQITVANKTAGTVTLTVQDKASPAKSLLSAVSITANTTYVIAIPEGVKMTGGIAWQASAGNSLDAEIKGYYKG